MSEFMKSNPALDALIAECTDPEKIRELTKAHLQEAGLISRERGEDYGVRLLRQPESEPDVSLPANTARETCMRVVYPSGQNRFEIYGASEQELDQKEQQIRNMFGGQR
jgi:hypothetical protein